ncbi:MAG: hypothetical protein GX868_17190 [Actinobacteria bacterium]|nr:hypothetical protein [Actinomycetota bacterium]
MRNTGVAVAGVLALTASLTMVGVAGAQDGEGTTVVETTAAPPTTIESPAPEVTEPVETTVPESTPSPTSVVEPPAGEIPTDNAPPSDAGTVLEPVALPGNVVTSGTLEFNVSFSDSPSSSCSGTVALSSGQMNIGYDEEGRVGGLYGLTSTGSGTLGALLVGLGPIPAGVAVISVSDANCEFDALGIGSWAATAATAQFGGIGFGLHPGAYDTGSYIDTMSAKATIGATGGAANLDLGQLEQFLLRSRPGLTLDLPGSGGGEGGGESGGGTPLE